jgi:hypothetical protein
MNTEVDPVLYPQVQAEIRRTFVQSITKQRGVLSFRERLNKLRETTAEYEVFLDKQDPKPVGLEGRIFLAKRDASKLEKLLEKDGTDEFDFAAAAEILSTLLTHDIAMEASMRTIMNRK